MWCEQVCLSCSWFWDDVQSFTIESGVNCRFFLDAFLLGGENSLRFLVPWVFLSLSFSGYPMICCCCCFLSPVCLSCLLVEKQHETSLGDLGSETACPQVALVYNECSEWGPRCWFSLKENSWFFLYIFFQRETERGLHGYEPLFSYLPSPRPVDSHSGVFWRTETLHFSVFLFIIGPFCAILKKYLLIQALQDII